MTRAAAQALVALSGEKLRQCESCEAYWAVPYAYPFQRKFDYWPSCAKCTPAQADVLRKEWGAHLL